MSHAPPTPPSVVVNTASDRQQVPLRDYLNARVAPFLKKAITESLNAEAEFPLQWLGECLIHQSILYEGNPDRTNIRERFLYKFEDPKPQEPADASVAASAPATAPAPPHRSPSAQPEPAPIPPQEPTVLQPEITMNEASEGVSGQPQPSQPAAEDDAAPQTAPVTEEPAVNGVKEEGEARVGDATRDIDTEMGGTS
ncbi:uncharacterized protein Z520_05397 [Fonsecaea multimorphosa CBS 102226]|uniref:Uncharacterized protein n=1 Tax=Fonsecaea multimorphosa CBS 102226 TaxID=1442371 RepID=A0A0D2IPU8_9EURO|nr:uncharacterized protein Z520_05397 [Fonsecaea multimorphosa CBS 102226]KIX98936.1 hypothetical protein Z520_05397 [Fonsecaea multimorphosa CBS 102226]OAL25209.1 hypothetical protein AYO22_05086 [Fonsecaea multimorphosa]